MSMLAMIVREVESGNNPYAIRYEPGFHKRLTLSQRAYKQVREWHQVYQKKWGFITLETYLILLSSSWGLYQILGYNLDGFTKFAPAVYWSSVSLQDQTFREYIERRWRNYEDVERLVLTGLEKDNPIEVAFFINGYNGAVSGTKAFEDYYQKMRRAYLKLKAGK